MQTPIQRQVVYCNVLPLQSNDWLYITGVLAFCVRGHFTRIFDNHFHLFREPSLKNMSYLVTPVHWGMIIWPTKSTTKMPVYTVYSKKYAHGFCFAVLCCGYILTDFPTSIRLTSLALWQSNDCPSASKATLMNMDKYFMWIHYERLHNHNNAKHNKTVCIFLGI